MPDWRFEPDSWTRAAFQSVGDDLRRRRLQHGWSMRAVARRAGVAPSTILRLERGELAASLLLVVRVARALDGVIIGQRVPPPRSRAADIGLEPEPDVVADDPPTMLLPHETQP